MDQGLESKTKVLKALLKAMYSSMASKKAMPEETEEEEEGEAGLMEKMAAEDDSEGPSLAEMFSKKKKKLPKFSMVSMSVSAPKKAMKKGKY